MNTSTTLTVEQHANLYAQARRDALALRRAAIDAFWLQAFRLGARALRTALPLQKAAPRLPSARSQNLTGA